DGIARGRRRMLKNTKAQAIVLVALGVLLGYAAASGNLEVSWPLLASSAEKQAAADIAPRPDGCPGAACCSEGVTHGQLLARADTKDGQAADPKQPAAAGKKPNILVIFGDDIGIPQLSAYTQGLMGYRTPNIDRIAREGALFTDSYGQQSCTAGRASFILGMEPFRTGLLTIGMPGDPHGITPWMPTIANVMKTQGYATGQFGKNHLGDRDEHLPTKHGFDEFFGNLYHLNAEEEPEGYFYPKDPEFKKKYGPRGVIHSWANADGTQKIEDTGPL